MGYPIKDKTLEDKIITEMNTSLTKNFDDEITKLRNKAVNDTFKTKLKDEGFGKDHQWENLKHSHNGSLPCKRCLFEKTEIEAETIVNNLTGLEKTDTESGEKTLQKFTVFRGKLGDVLGYQWDWS